MSGHISNVRPKPDKVIADIADYALDYTIGKSIRQPCSRAEPALGTLRPGAPADIAVLELREDDFEFVDNIDGKRTGHRKLFTSAVVMNGKKGDITREARALQS